jgi:hypothetical protein
MTTDDLPPVVFFACDTLRIAAHVPQMIMLARHADAAASFSFGTWALFAAANLSTAFYAGAMLGDATLSIMSALSALCCGALIGLAAWRRPRPRTSVA